MATRFRRSPPVCLVISLAKLIIGKLKFSKQFLGNSIKMEDGSEFKIFRHITTPHHISEATIFIVNFKFARLSHKANKLASIIPMLLITGFPGFNTKMYAVNVKNGYWQGMYLWESTKHLNNYKASFVFRMMNKRAISNTINSMEYDNLNLVEFIENHKIH